MDVDPNDIVARAAPLERPILSISQKSRRRLPPYPPMAADGHHAPAPSAPDILACDPHMPRVVDQTSCVAM
jgi:hypothetical protein